MTVPSVSQFDARVGETPDQVAFIAAIPVFNDWAAARLLLSKLDTALRAANLRVQVILIDDGSTVPAELDFRELNLEAVCSIEVLLLRRNLGHQRAIAIGLTYAHHQTKDLPILVMDADGEDSPGDVPSLYRKFQEELGQKVIFAKRSKRSESLGFRVFYQIYKLTYRMLTGFDVNVGNFSIAPAIAVDRLVVVSELWSHYAAAVHKARILYATIDTKRDKRLDGESRMNFVALVIHGLSAISVFSQATNWKRYYASLLRPYIHGRVLEVGAGIGGTTPYLWNRTCSEWVCLEPDRRLLEKLRANLASHPEMTGIETSVGTTADIPNSEKYDCILYIDVLEHLEQDRAELDKASNFVAEGGRIIVLSPAHQWLFSPFDAALGHVRRYTRKTLRTGASTTVNDLLGHGHIVPLG